MEVVYIKRLEGNEMNVPLMRILPKECPFCHDIPVLAKDPL